MKNYAFLTKTPFLFLSLLAIEVIYTIYFISMNTLPLHDVFARFSLQYYFLNNAVISGEIPQWIPQLTHGAPATWWSIIQGTHGILTIVFFQIAYFLKYINFISLFHISILFDKCILLTGIWLLSKRYFSSPLTIFFVSSIVMGSVVWTGQTYFNLQLYYAIPLILYFVHQFFDNAEWKYLFFALNLYAVQSLGNLFYFLPVTSLIMFLYFALYTGFNFEEFKSRLLSIKLDRTFLIYLGLTCLMVIPFYFLFQFGADQELVLASSKRTAEGFVSLDNFISYGANFSVRNLLEFFLGISPFLDYTIYIGLLPLAFIFHGVFSNLKSKNFHLPCLIVILVLFALGTQVAVLFYYVWPFMKVFRHIGLTIPVIKIFLALLAGFGFEALLINDLTTHKKKNIFLLIISGSFFLYIGAWLYMIAPSGGISVFGKILENISVLNMIILLDEHVSSRLTANCSYAFILAIFLFSLFYIRQTKYRVYLILFCVLFHLNDLYGQNFYETNLRSFHLNSKHTGITSFQAMPYINKRLSGDVLNNPRRDIISEKYTVVAALYWTLYPLLFEDQLHSSLRIESWTNSLDQLMHAYWNEPLDDPGIVPIGFQLIQLTFPTHHPSSLKVTGVIENKIQFFRNAYTLDNNNQVALALTHESYKGDSLFITDQSRQDMAQNHPTDFASNERLNIPFEVTQFDANNMKITVEVPNNIQSAWLYYADAWHPGWKAKVNNKNTPVYKANLAYKAVQLLPGNNEVHFYFKSVLLERAYQIIALNALFWVFAIGWLIRRISRDSL